jgi:tetratricopeptide (TPR) repeat protein
MNFRYWAKYFVAFIFCASAFSQQASNPRAQAELDQGIAQYKQEDYKRAAGHFRKALQIDPEFVQARLYLARTLTAEFDPGVNTPKNLALAAAATDEFKELLRRRPHDAEAMKGIATLLARTDKTEEARQYLLQVASLNPADSDAYTMLGEMDYWSAVRKRDSTSKFVDSASPIDHPLCKSVREATLPMLDRSIEELKKAFALNDASDAAATFLSLAYSVRANMECGDPKTRDADRKQGSAWMDQSMKARHKDPTQPPVFQAVKL